MPGLAAEQEPKEAREVRRHSLGAGLSGSPRPLAQARGNGPTRGQREGSEQQGVAGVQPGGVD
eukprot:8733865-Pyramimonas_sp.AAC.1